ncbi:MAG: hypothetical protein AABN95_21730 [Acidobacteriota bacterium]
MSTTIVIDLRDETKAALNKAAREEDLSQNELIDKALQDYLFIRRFRNLRERMIAQAGKASLIRKCSILARENSPGYECPDSRPHRPRRLPRIARTLRYTT